MPEGTGVVLNEFQQVPLKDQGIFAMLVCELDRWHKCTVFLTLTPTQPGDTPIPFVMMGEVVKMSDLQAEVHDHFSYGGTELS